VSEVVDEEFAAGFEEGADFGEEEFVVFHMFEEFDAEDAVEGVSPIRTAEVVGGDVASDDCEVLEAFFRSDGVDVLFLGAGVGEGCYLRVGEDFGKVEG
jgi:hypothetical protein